MSIPKIIHQTFEHLDFSQEFQNIVNDWKIENPNFEHKLYNRKEREKFIKQNFSLNVYNAYKKIKPGAFKADLWRYCILHEYGGFYADIDTLCLSSLDKFIGNKIEFVATIDLNEGYCGYHNVANAFIGCTPQHPIIKNCIERILNWIENETFPTWNLDFSGPGCLGRSVNKFLSREEDKSMVGFEGNHSGIVLLNFEPKTEFVRDLNYKKILQNKNGNSIIKELYDKECNKVKNYFDWGSFGHGVIRFQDMVKVDPFTPSNELTTLENYHNNSPATFSLYKYCGISDCIRRGYRWEEHQHEVIDKYLNSNSIALEVGAHIGTLTVKLSKTVQKVYAFEPIENSFKLLNKNLQLNNCNNVQTFQKGVADKISSTYVRWVGEKNAGGTGLEGGYLSKSNNLKEKIKVNLISIDSLNLDKLDYIKVDAEGYEELVIKGAQNTIKKHLPLIVLECFDENYFDSHKFDAPKAPDDQIQKRFKFLLDLGYSYTHLHFEDFLFIPSLIS
jgi:FkbM family methyltransferase